jgi:hypothetical protein
MQFRSCVLARNTGHDFRSSFFGENIHEKSRFKLAIRFWQPDVRPLLFYRNHNRIRRTALARIRSPRLR